MSNKLITDSFPKTKKDKLITKDLRQTKPRTSDLESKAKDSTEIRVDKEAKDLAQLRQFDMTSEYGPCIGITRLERWERADKYGLNPPSKVKEIISHNPSNDRFTECLWNDENL